MLRKNRNSTKKKRVPSINLRVNILFAIIFVLFMALVGRLYYIQIIDHQFYADKLKETGYNTTVTTSEARGQIFDAQGRALVTTSVVPSITFTRNPGITAEQMRINAQKLVPILRDFIQVSDTDPSTRDKKDYFLSDPTNLKATDAKLPDSKRVDKNGKKLSQARIYEEDVKLVTNDQIQFSGDDLLAVELFKRMNATQTFATSNIISGDLSAVQQAQAAVLQGTTGISTGQDWVHSIADNNLLSPLMGTVGPIQGNLTSYKAKGYLMNDQVGTSYLEKSYESVLQGKHQITKITVNPDGTVKSRTDIQKGAQGENLKLTVNLDFENGVQQILESNFNSILPSNPGAQGAYVVVLNSKTGAVLAMNGIGPNPSTGVMETNSAYPMLNAYVPGSTVKPGTLTAGWETGAISGNQVITSQPLLFAGSNPIRDWNFSGFGPIPADVALEYSSNTYMAQVALKILGQNYTPDMMVSTTNRVKAYNAMRAAYGEYGLGVSTGIDIPGEEPGLHTSTDSDNATVANLLFEAFGQFDTYTPLQLAQYAQTIANNGVRLAPHIVEGIYQSNDSTLGKEVTAIQPKVLNKVNISQADMDIIHLGMKEVVYGVGATGTAIASGAKTEIYAKTGTSESGAAGSTSNNLIAYAPGPNPQIAIGIMIPNISDENNIHVNQTMLTQIVNLALQQGIIKQ